jgi:hypothetical protein
MHFFAEIYRDLAGCRQVLRVRLPHTCEYEVCRQLEWSVATHARFPSFLFSKNVIWPLMIANFIAVCEKSASKVQE